MNKLKELRKSKKITLDKLSKLVNIAPNTISQYENDKREASYETLAILSKFYNVSIDYILNNQQKEKKHGVKIPVLGVIPAGIPIEAIEDILDYEEISEDLASTGEFFALKVKGDSMSPQILENDIVIIRQQPDADSGDVCVVFVNGYDATLKRIKKERIGITLLPNNPAYSPMFYTNKEIEELPVRILGKAIEIRRGI